MIFDLIKKFARFLSGKLNTIIAIFAGAFTIASILSGLPPILALIAAGIFVTSAGIWFIADEKPFLNVRGLEKVKSFSSEPDYLVFVYGSLLSKSSLLRSLSVSQDELHCIPARLYGYSPQWNVFSCRPDYLAQDGTTFDAHSMWGSLGVAAEEKDESQRRYVSGAIIGINKRHYMALRYREKHYQPINVRHCIQLVEQDATLPTSQAVFAFIPSREKISPLTAKTISIRENYYTEVRQALRKLGFDGEDLAHLESLPELAEIKKAYLVNDLIDKNYLPYSKSNADKLKKLNQDLSDVIKADRRELNLPVDGHRDSQFSLRPIILPSVLYDKIALIAESAVSITSKALCICSKEQDLLKYFGYSEDEIAVVEAGVQRGEELSKIARVDMVVLGNDIKVFEVNADSPGGMRHLDLLAQTHERVLRECGDDSWIAPPPIDLMRECVRSLSTYGSARDGIFAIAEVRPDRWSTYPEICRFQRELAKDGETVKIADVAKERWTFFEDEGILRNNDNEVIRKIYKRAVIEDLRESNTETYKAMKNAYLENAVHCVNGLAARIAGSKAVLALAMAKEFPEWCRALEMPLCEREINSLNDNFPRTFIWGDTPALRNLSWSQGPNVKSETLDDTDAWVLKSFDGFGGSNVLIGADAGSGNIQQEFQRKWNKGYIVQEFVPHGTAMTPYIEPKPLVRYENFIIGAYVIDGKFIAAEAKLGGDPPINMAQGAKRAPVFPTRRE